MKGVDVIVREPWRLKNSPAGMSRVGLQSAVVAPSHRTFVQDDRLMYFGFVFFCWHNDMTTNTISLRNEIPRTQIAPDRNCPRPPGQNLFASLQL